jgi:alkanesulfonate monooxygenase SsuD/methylene tetrahydromethanopterin reductase-like flavin-dependent oxidoreductase (luciferase family)
VGAVVPVMLTDDAEAGRAYAREKFAIYGTLPRYQRVVELGDGAHPSDVCLVGDEAAVRDGLRRYRDAGLTDFLAAPLAHGDATWERTARGLSQIAGLA